jgi:hypothetical protein
MLMVFWMLCLLSAYYFAHVYLLDRMFKQTNYPTKYSHSVHSDDL